MGYLLACGPRTVIPCHKEMAQYWCILWFTRNSLGSWFTFIYILFENWVKFQSDYSFPWKQALGYPQNKGRANRSGFTWTSSGGAEEWGIDEGTHWHDRKCPHQNGKATKTRIVCLHPSAPPDMAQVPLPAPVSTCLFCLSHCFEHSGFLCSPPRGSPRLWQSVTFHPLRESISHLLGIFNILFSDCTNIPTAGLLHPERKMQGCK